LCSTLTRKQLQILTRLDMTVLSPTYTKTKKAQEVHTMIAQTNFSSRIPLPQTPAAQPSKQIGSHMPLDTSVHWDWSNPLNILPITMLLLIVFALIAVVLA
jgi:hypothetical protein